MSSMGGPSDANPPRVGGREMLYTGLDITATTLLYRSSVSRPGTMIPNATETQLAATALLLLHRHTVDIGRGSSAWVGQKFRQEVLVPFAEDGVVTVPMGRTVAEIKKLERDAIEREIASKRGARDLTLESDLSQGKLILGKRILGEGTEAFDRVDSTEAIQALRTARLFELMTSHPTLPFTFEAACGLLDLSEHRPGLIQLVDSFRPKIC